MQHTPNSKTLMARPAVVSSDPVDSLESITTETADYRYTFEPCTRRIRAVFNDVTVADSHSVMEMRETRLAPVYYFPRSDVRMDLMRRTTHQTYCPFKGNASYWSLDVNGRVAENVLWSYEDPFAGANEIKDYVALYADQIDAWYDDDKDVTAKKDESASTYANPLLSWLLHDAADVTSSKELTAQLAEHMLTAGIPLWRLAIIIRTLHPQVAAVAYKWSAKHEGIEEMQATYSTQQTPEYLNSPLVPIYEGAGGIRRRLDIPNPVLDFGILKDLHAEGATDYVAMPMLFSDGQINVVTMSSNRPGGFSTSDLGHVYEILSLLGRLYEVHTMRRTAVTLLDTYLGQHAGTRVLQGLIKRGDGESINAVIWFCDLRESTPLARSMSQEQFLGALNEFFDCMAGAVLEHGGQVLRFIGDAALAIFPVAGAESDWEEDSATPEQARDKALAAAVDASHRIDMINQKRSKDGEVQLKYGLALHMGEVTYGNIGTEERLEFTVVGDAANQTARIEAMCKTLGEPILLSAEFARHFPGRFQSLGPHRLRGIDGEQEIFALREMS